MPVSDFFEDSRLSVAHGQFHLAEPFHRLLNEFYSANLYSHKVAEGLISEYPDLYLSLLLPRPQSAVPSAYEGECFQHGLWDYPIYRFQRRTDIPRGGGGGGGGRYSSSYLSHLFKEKTGMTLQSYLARKKIERGVELMKSGCYSWTQIALELHYETPQAFSKAFRRVMQKSPSEFITNTHKKRSESNE